VNFIGISCDVSFLIISLLYFVKHLSILFIFSNNKLLVSLTLCYCFKVLI
jgi:hypothetical protein